MEQSLAMLFAEVFGYNTQAFKPQFDTVPYPKQLSSKNGTPYYGTDAFGREYFMPVKFTYTLDTVLPDGTVTTGPVQKYDLPWPIISISSRKKIVETELTERRGTVKELINIQDYEITIRGFLINGIESDYPEDDVDKLREMHEQLSSISMSCALTDLFLLRNDRSGSDKVVIRELDFPELPGVQNIQPYVMRLVSDEEFNLIDIS